MLFFHKSFNKRLLKHISELDAFGLLPSDWQWHREKLEQLDYISEEMIDDLIHLHNAHQDLGETIPHIFPLIQELHQDIETMIKQDVIDEQMQEKEAETVNRLIMHLKDFLEKQGTIGGDYYPHMCYHLSPKEIVYYNSLLEKGHLKKAFRYLKNKWNERVNRHFIQSINTIHWGNIEAIEYALTKMNRRHELSCIGYEKPPYGCFWGRGLGILVKGWVTLAGNMDLGSNMGLFGIEKRYTGYAARLILNKKTFVSSQGYTPIEKSIAHNEFLVAHWKPQALVYDQDILNADDFDKYIGRKVSTEEIIIFLKQFSSKFNLQLMDKYGRYI